MSQHLAHLRYLLRRKWLFFRLGKLVDVGLWERLTHDLYQFRPTFWRLGVRVLTQMDPEEWIKRRAKEIMAWRKRIAIKPLPETSEDDAIEVAKDEHLALTKQLAKLSDWYSLMVQHTARHRWEFYVIRDMGSARRVEMPEKWLRAMVADWMTGSLLSGTPREDMPRSVRLWFAAKARDINIGPDARRFVHDLLKDVK